MGRKSRERAAALATRKRQAAEGITIREARPGEGETVRQLLLPVDPEHPDVFDPLSDMIDSGLVMPPDRGLCLNLVAENRDGKLVGALSAVSPFDWITGSDQLAQPFKPALARNIATIESLAVAPQARGMRLGFQLLKHAEAQLRESGCRLLIVDFEPSRSHLARYYTEAGFRLLAYGQPLHIGLLPGVILPRPSHKDHRTSWKALTEEITLEPALMTQGPDMPPVPVPGGVLVGVLAANHMATSSAT
ncbi:GNAT family N-acetyltransferase [Streptomyces rectiverticillatus]|uniref:GNAT family N-acetyltransferase n=1 Tax=Streptomyces rectiverticillatus TaxID=173860 RepID=UPI0015C3192A|nr:GNAT family N-acetyltransferase [Streptomyces rectiverticillatus]QLE71774.1 GNAT family N-acetyltransferase [Streptomyces rectiverticillatus]